MVVYILGVVDPAMFNVHTSGHASQAVPYSLSQYMCVYMMGRRWLCEQDDTDSCSQVTCGSTQYY